MVQSLNTKTSQAFSTIAYVGLGSIYGNVLIGDKAFEFFNESNVEDAIQIPWDTIDHVEGVVTRNHKIGRQFVIVLKSQGRSKRHNHMRFSSKSSGTMLKLVREQLGNDKVVKLPTVTDKVLSLFSKRKG